MTRSCPLWLALILALLPSTFVAADDAPAALDLSGQWMSSYGPVTLQQNGLAIVGAFTEGTNVVQEKYMQGKTITAEQWSANANPGTITDGIIDPDKRTLAFKFHEEASQLDGTVTATLSKDGNTLEGPYDASGMGGNRSGTWTMAQQLWLRKVPATLLSIDRQRRS